MTRHKAGRRGKDGFIFLYALHTAGQSALLKLQAPTTTFVEPLLMNTSTVSVPAVRSLPRLRARGAAMLLALGLAGASGLVTAQPAPPSPPASAPMPGGPMHMHGHGGSMG